MGGFLLAMRTRVYHREVRSATGGYESITKKPCRFFFKTFPPGILLAMSIRLCHGFSLEDSRLKRLLSLLLAILLSQAASFAQRTDLETSAAKTIQQSETIDISPIPPVELGNKIGEGAASPLRILLNLA